MTNVVNSQIVIMNNRDMIMSDAQHVLICSTATYTDNPRLKGQPLGTISGHDMENCPETPDPEKLAYQPYGLAKGQHLDAVVTAAENNRDGNYIVLAAGFIGTPSSTYGAHTNEPYSLSQRHALIQGSQNNLSQLIGTPAATIIEDGVRLLKDFDTPMNNVRRIGPNFARAVYPNSSDAILFGSDHTLQWNETKLNERRNSRSP